MEKSVGRGVGKLSYTLIRERVEVRAENGNETGGRIMIRAKVPQEGLPMYHEKMPKPVALAE